MNAARGIESGNQYHVALIGFDSAWTDSGKAPGAYSALLLGGSSNQPKFVAPKLASFDQTVAGIDELSLQSNLTLIAIDQPTIVPNLLGMRPVERVAASVISFVGGGVQPSSRKRADMFGDDAPIWRFKKRVAALEVPSLSRSASSGRFLLEVYPALALTGLNTAFYNRKSGPRYNPIRRDRFQLGDWKEVILTLQLLAAQFGIDEIVDWLEVKLGLSSPSKSDQDMLDSVICLLIAWCWRFGSRENMIVIGDSSSGYMVAPVSIETRERLTRAAAKLGVPIDQF